MRPWLALKSRSGYTTQRQSNRTSKAGAETPLGLALLDLSALYFMARGRSGSLDSSIPHR